MSASGSPSTRRLLQALLPLALAGWALGCARDATPPQEPPPRYEDFVTSGRLARADGTSSTGEVFCADETRFGVVLEPGSQVRLSTRLGGAPSLLLSACAEGGEAPADDTGGEDAAPWLTVTVEGERGLSSEMRVELSAEQWSARTLELPAHAGGQVGIRLVAGPRPVMVADLAVRHRVARTAGRSSEHERDGGLWSRLRGTTGKRQPRILLISVDTLRADAVGTLAAPTEQPTATPNLDAFAAEAEIWTPHYAAASWTKPSHASLLTGLPPAVHGAVGIEDPMRPTVKTLAERLSAAGLATAGLVYDCRWLAPDFGFAQGFDTYAVVPWRASQEVRGTANWIGEHLDRGFFYFLHLFTPHSDAHVLPYEGDGTTRREVERLFGVEGYGCRTGRCASTLLTALNEGLAPLPQEEEILRHLYRSGVADVDRALGALFRDLREAGLWDAMTVVVTSDHGEAFFEHGGVLHGTLHQEVVRVPLLIKWPGGARAGTRRETPSSALDLAPTLLEAAGLAADDLPGSPLGRRPDAPIFAGTLDRTVIDGRWKLILPLRDRPEELYDLVADPLERRNLVADPLGHRNLETHLARLRALFEAELARERELREALGAGTGEGAGPTLTPEERERLEALGYL